MHEEAIVNGLKRQTEEMISSVIRALASGELPQRSVRDHNLRWVVPPPFP